MKHRRMRVAIARLKGENKMTQEILKMPVLEHFVSLNGEGMNSGKPVMFIRLVGCNLRCDYGCGTCDTPESLEYPQARKCKDYVDMSARELATLIQEAKVKRICLTGGEPLGRKHIGAFINELNDLLNREVLIEIETNGSIDLPGLGIVNDDSISFTVDYKSISSKMNGRMRMENWAYLTEKDSIKFVVANREEMDDAVQKIRQYQPKANLIFSPMFGRMDLEELWTYCHQEAVMDLDLKVQVQLHKIFFDPAMKGV